MSPRRFLPTRWWLVMAVLLLVAASAVTAYVVWPRGSELERAAALLPDDTGRVTWTDWAGIREEVDQEPGSDAFLEEIDARDLGAASVLAHSAGPLEAQLGVNPLEAEWEILGQGPEGMVLVLKLDEETDLGDVAERYREAGFTEPADRSLDGGVWQGGPDVLARLDELGDPVLQHVAFLEEERLLITSDAAGYLEQAMPTVREGDGLDLGGLAGHVEEPLAAVGFADDLACQALSMSLADAGTQAVADSLVEDAGGVTPLAGYLVALEPDRRITVALGFEDEDRAEHDAAARRQLASGEDPGQGVAYPDVFSVEDSKAEGEVVVLTLERVDDGGYPLTNLTQGPVMLAAC